MSRHGTAFETDDKLLTEVGEIYRRHFRGENYNPEALANDLQAAIAPYVNVVHATGVLFDEVTKRLHERTEALSTRRTGQVDSDPLFDDRPDYAE